MDTLQSDLIERKKKIFFFSVFVYNLNELFTIVYYRKRIVLRNFMKKKEVHSQEFIIIMGLPVPDYQSIRWSVNKL